MRPRSRIPERLRRVVSFTLTFSAAILALLAIVYAIGVSGEGPAIGDIVSFDGQPTAAASTQPSPADALNRKVVIPPITAGRVSPVRGSCVLDPTTMAAGGGSFVVEAKDNTTAADPYRIHWRGAATSAPRTDCGGDADLMLSTHDIVALAMTAGGFGVAPSKVLILVPRS